MILWLGAVVTSLVLCGLRLSVARVVGLSDAEGLHVAYGLHPQPAYLDHPGLIGWIAQALGPQTAPTQIHVLTALASTALPWVGVLAARACGATRGAALRTYFAVALVPELSIGSFGFTPQLLLAFSWLITLGCAGWAMRHDAADFGTLLACLGAGAGAALGCLSHNGGWLLAASLLVASVASPRAGRFRTLAPWAACVLFVILTAPLLGWWRTRGLSLRWSDDVSLQSAAGTLFKPLIAATPPFVYAGFVLARELWRPHRQSGVDRLLRLGLLIPVLPQALLAIYTTAAADWLIPAYLVLGLHAARAPAIARGLARSCVGVGATIAVFGWCWLRTDLPFHTGELLGGYEPSLDPSNDLYAWGPGRQLLESAVVAARDRTGRTPVVVGPHWSICAQADVTLAGSVHVGCDSLELDDYDDWSHPSAWSNANTILFVTDTRFHGKPPESFHGRPAVTVHQTSVERFGRSVREISVTEFDREEATATLSRLRSTGPLAR